MSTNTCIFNSFFFLFLSTKNLVRSVNLINGIFNKASMYLSNNHVLFRCSKEHSSSIVIVIVCDYDECKWFGKPKYLIF